MIYKFTSKASGDVIMLGPQGDELLRLLGREPAPKGIFEVADMPSMLRVLQAAAESKPATSTGRPVAHAADASEEAAEASVGLRQRLWPIVDMLKRCHAARQAVVWGV